MKEFKNEIRDDTKNFKINTQATIDNLSSEMRDLRMKCVKTGKMKRIVEKWIRNGENW